MDKSNEERTRLKGKEKMLGEKERFVRKEIGLRWTDRKEGTVQEEERWRSKKIESSCMKVVFVFQKKLGSLSQQSLAFFLPPGTLRCGRKERFVENG